MKAQRPSPGRFLILPGLAALTAGEVLAVGFRLPNQDPEAIARGNAFAATADNPSAIYYNPAGITQLEGHQFRVGAYFVSPGVEYTSPGGARAKAEDDYQPVPQLYYTWSPKNSPWSFGLGLYAPYGLAMDWGRTSPFATLAQNGQVRYLSLNPVVAWEILPSLSVALGPTINYSDAEFERAVFVPGADLFRFQGAGLGYGFNAGVRWQPAEQWSLGLNYRSETEVEYEGESFVIPYDLAGRRATHGPLTYPQFVVLGVSYRPTPKWNLEVNVDWTDWEQVDQIVFRGTFPADAVLPLNLRSSWMYEAGVTRQFGDGYFASLGYFFSQGSYPTAAFNPILPDTDLHLGSFGLGRRGQRWDWAAAYHFGYNPGRTVTGSQPGLADGRYEVLNHGFNLAVTLKF